MKISLLATLEAAITEWLTAAAESDDWPDAYVSDSLSTEMATAAAAVFDASANGQRFAKEQEGA